PDAGIGGRSGGHSGERSDDRAGAASLVELVFARAGRTALGFSAIAGSNAEPRLVAVDLDAANAVAWSAPCSVDAAVLVDGGTRAVVVELDASGARNVTLWDVERGARGGVIAHLDERRRNWPDVRALSADEALTRIAILDGDGRLTKLTRDGTAWHRSDRV